MICINKIIHILFLWLCRSLVEQMKEAAQAYMDLLEGKDKPVFGSTCKFHCSVFWNVGHFYYFDGIRLVFTTCSGYRCDQFLNRITQSAFIYCFIDIQSSENALKCVEVLAPTLRNVWLRPTSKFRSAEQKRLKSFKILFERHSHVLRRDGGMQDKGFVLGKKKIVKKVLYGIRCCPSVLCIRIGLNTVSYSSPVKLLKEELTRLLNCKYFSCLPPPSSVNAEELNSATSFGSKNIAHRKKWELTNNIANSDFIKT